MVTLDFGGRSLEFLFVLFKESYKFSFGLRKLLLAILHIIRFLEKQI